MTQYQDWPSRNVFCLMICHKTEANIFPPMHCHYPLARKMDQAVHHQHIQAYLDCQSKKMKVVIHHQTNFQFQEKEPHQDKVLPPMT
ncbi:hypothetical protein T4D_3566, partial [Trichinella pseudospiralis]